MHDCRSSGTRFYVIRDTDAPSASDLKFLSFRPTAPDARKNIAVPSAVVETDDENMLSHFYVFAAARGPTACMKSRA
jgi:hypothetical protein